LIGSVCLTGDFGTTEMEMGMMRDVHMRGDGRVDCVDSIGLCMKTLKENKMKN
jgi:hypothetical protein